MFFKNKRINRNGCEQGFNQYGILCALGKFDIIFTGLCMVLERADIKKLIQAVFWYAYAFMLLLADNSGKFSD